MMLFPNPWYVHGRTINPGRPEDMAAVKVKHSLAQQLMGKIKTIKGSEPPVDGDGSGKRAAGAGKQ